MWHWIEDLPGTPDDLGLRWGFTSARGGVSSGPYAGLNLGGHVGDDAGDVERNRELLAADLGLDRAQLVFMNQVHGADVAVLDGPPAYPVTADALVTTRPDLALAVLVADCVPVLLADRGRGVIGVAHAGRPGMLAGVVPAAVTAMRQAGARSIEAVVGPSVCGACYEVPGEMRAAAAQVVPESAAATRQGTPSIDVAAGVRAQLRELAVPVREVGVCTQESDSLYSYRRARVTGRQAGVVRLVSA